MLDNNQPNGTNNSSYDNSDIISSLPAELALQAFSFLEPRELAQAGEVCRKWHQLSRDNVCWLRFFLNQRRLGENWTR